MSAKPSPPFRKPSSDRKSTRLNSSHLVISYAVFCLKKKKQLKIDTVLTDKFPINLPAIDPALTKFFNVPFTPIQYATFTHSAILKAISRPYLDSIL